MNDLIRAREEGFTLLEVIVAFVVLSLCLIAVNKSVALATMQIRRADEVRQAEELAQQILTDVILSNNGIARHARGGSEAGLQWKLNSKPIDSASKLATTQVTLIIRSVAGRHIRDYITFLPKAVVKE